jgi:hypothetical protein
VGADSAVTGGRAGVKSEVFPVEPVPPNVESPTGLMCAIVESPTGLTGGRAVGIGTGVTNPARGCASVGAEIGAGTSVNSALPPVVFC